MTHSSKSIYTLGDKLHLAYFQAYPKHIAVTTPKVRGGETWKITDRSGVIKNIGISTTAHAINYSQIEMAVIVRS